MMMFFGVDEKFPKSQTKRRQVSHEIDRLFRRGFPGGRKLCATFIVITRAKRDHHPHETTKNRKKRKERKEKTRRVCVPPAPSTSILIVPLGPRLVLITSCKPFAALMFMNKAAALSMLSAFGFTERREEDILMGSFGRSLVLVLLFRSWSAFEICAATAPKCKMLTLRQRRKFSRVQQPLSFSLIQMFTSDCFLRQNLLSICCYYYYYYYYYYNYCEKLRRRPLVSMTPASDFLSAT